MTIILTEENCYTISSFLRTSAERFKEFATMCKKDAPTQPGLAKQFELQQAQAETFAAFFEDSTNATLSKASE